MTREGTELSNNAITGVPLSRYAAGETAGRKDDIPASPLVFHRMFVVVNHVSIADASEGRYEMDVREYAEQHLVNQLGFRRLELMHPETDGDYLLLAYWNSEAAFEQWMTTNDFEAAHDELFGTMFLDPDYVDRYESTATIEAP